MERIIAFQVAEQINLKLLQKAYTAKPLHQDTAELFYADEHQHLIQVMVYGVVTFRGYDDIKMSEFLEFVQPFCKNLLAENLTEELELVTEAPELVLGYNTIHLPRANEQAMRLVMMHVAQSVALDYNAQFTDQLLEDTKRYTDELERTGRLGIGDRELRRYIGKTLNLKTRVAENLYILDSPAVTWEDEYLDQIDRGLKRTLDLSIRYRNNVEDLAIIKENLDLFKDLLLHRKSNMLEWIIIVLILVEVINMLIEKVF